MKFNLKQDVYIFDAGSRGRHMLKILEDYSIHVVAFIDNDPSKWGDYM